MSSTCIICKNSNDSQHFVRSYQDSYVDLYKRNLLKEKADFSYVHPICASFFPETDLIMPNSATNPNLFDHSENQVVTEAIICNAKEITRQTNEYCEICAEKTGEEVLLPCFEKQCKRKFHLSCCMKSEEIKKMKLVKTDNSTFKYGVMCPHHWLKDDNPIELKSDIYTIFKVLDMNLLWDELTSFEKMLTSLNQIIRDDPWLHSIVELLANLSDTEERETDNLHKKNVEKKRNGIKIKSKKKEKSEKKEGEEEASEGEKSRKQSSEEKSNEPKKGKNNRVRDLAREREMARARKKKLKNKTINKELGKFLETLLAPSSQKPQNGKIAKFGQFKQKEAIVAVRKKSESGEGLNYNLRGEIKATSRLKFELLQEFATPKKPKPKTPGEPVVNSKMLTGDEKKKNYWRDFDGHFFRRPHTDEAEFLIPSQFNKFAEVVKSLTNPEQPESAEEQEDQHYFIPHLDVSQLRAYTHPFFMSSLNNSSDRLKVLFEFKSNSKAGQTYLAQFQMKKKAQNEMEIPQDMNRIKLGADPKFIAIPSYASDKLKANILTNLKPLEANIDGRHRFNEENIDTKELSDEGYYKLLGLKSLDVITPEELLEIKSRNLFEQDLRKMEEEKAYDPDTDELSKELLYTEHLLENFLVPEINTRKEKVTYNLRDDLSLMKTIKLQEKSKKLESDFKTCIMKKYFLEGFKDKLNNYVTRGYVRNAKDQIVSELTFTPKIEKDSNVIKLTREKKPLSVVETDCCICFWNQFTEFNPIIYCSNCNASFHKFCYGLTELPSEDFFCDICLGISDPSLRKAKNTYLNTKNKKIQMQLKVKPTNQDKDIACAICSVDDFPLRKFRKADWFHITCLVLHDFAQLRSGEWSLRQDKFSQIDQIKAEGSQHECVICKNKNGIVAKCSHLDCSKHFHLMCAYIHGYKIQLQDTARRDDKNLFNYEISCAEHCSDPNRDLVKQQYFRRYTTNFKNTLNYETLEDYITHLNEEESNSQNTTLPEEAIQALPIDLNLGQQIDSKLQKREPEIPTTELEDALQLGPTKKLKV